MEDVVFDCTQFLTFKGKESRKGFSFLESKLKEVTKFRFLQNPEIAAKKLAYLNEYLNYHTVELINQEFIGEFDEWFEFDIIPASIEKFGKAIQEIIKEESIEQLAIILVRYAYQEKESNHIFESDFSSDQVYGGLYHASCFGNSGNIIVMRIGDS